MITLPPETKKALNDLVLSAVEEKTQSLRNKLERTQVMSEYWEGRYKIIKHENNKLRKANEKVRKDLEIKVVKKPMRRLYLLEDTESKGVDVIASMIVRATSPTIAREIGNHECKDEGEIWTDTKRVTCKPLKMDGKACVVLTDFNAG